jgi:hypothetical protein
VLRYLRRRDPAARHRPPDGPADGTSGGGARPPSAAVL